MTRHGFTSPAMCRHLLDATTATAAPRRKRRRKPSGVAPVLHLSGLVVACAAVLAIFAR